MDDLGERILKNLNTALNNDPLIDEYDFLPVSEPTHNRNPVLVEHHKLAVESWAVRLLYCHCYRRLLDWREKNKKPKWTEAAEIKQWSRAVLLIVPDCMTAWNIRKELAEVGCLALDEDLQLSQLILTKHPKSSETFTHRKRLLSRLRLDLLGGEARCHQRHSPGAAPCVSVPCPVATVSPGGSTGQLMDEWDRVVSAEVDVCQLAAQHYANNYHAWSHRLWMLQQAPISAKVLQAEMAHTQTFVSTHISDHCGYNFRQFLLRCLKCHLPQSQWMHLLKEELHTCTDLIECFPGHESMWYHRRAILFLMTSNSTSSDETAAHHLASRNKTGSQTDCNSLLNSSRTSSHVDGNHGNRVGSVRKKTKLQTTTTCDADPVAREVDFCDGILQKWPKDQWTHTLANKYLEWLQRTFTASNISQS